MSMSYAALLLAITLLACAGIGIAKPSLIRAMMQDLRLLRVLHYVALAWLGASIFRNTGGGHAHSFAPDILIEMTLLACALLLASVFATVTNNIEDLEADRISNPNRPLVRGTVDKRSYLIAGVYFLFLSLLLSAFSSPAMFFGILSISAGYYLYSCRPFRIKQIPLAGKFLIGLNSCFITLTGFCLAGGRWTSFPLSWTLFILIPLSLSANFVDLKDREGDMRTGVKTLPVLMGEKNARILISFFTILTYGGGAILSGMMPVLPLALAFGFLHVFFLYRKPYNEKPVFVLYLGAMLSLILLMTFKNFLLGG